MFHTERKNVALWVLARILKSSGIDNDLLRLLNKLCGYDLTSPAIDPVLSLRNKIKSRRDDFKHMNPGFWSWTPPERKAQEEFFQQIDAVLLEIFPPETD